MYPQGLKVDYASKGHGESLIVSYRDIVISGAPTRPIRSLTGRVGILSKCQCGGVNARQGRTFLPTAIILGRLHIR